MPDPETSDRERLLRLIDGGPDAARELQRQREAQAPKAEAVQPPPGAVESKPASVTPVPKTKGPKFAITEAQKARLAQAALAAALLMVAIWMVAGAFKSRPTTSTPAPAVSDMGALRLVGVDWSERPVALLEDKVTGKTYFVEKNDSVLGARVREIQKDRVMVSWRGQAVELR